MKKFVLLLVIVFSSAVYSQEDAWVYFNTKPNAQAFFDNPLSELSQRSLDRRIAQNIALDIKDVPMHQTYIDQITNTQGIVVLAKSKWFNALHVQGSEESIRALTNLNFVERVDFANRLLNNPLRPDVPRKKMKKVNKKFETDAFFNYGSSANQIEMLNGQLLHQLNFTGTGKIIAVMDGGFPGVDTAEPFSRLRDNNQILGGYDYVNRNADFYTGISHGTMVLSTMGGFQDNELVGTAPDASYYLFITEDGANEWPLELSLWVEAAEEADRLGADIITTSLGYTEFDNPNYNFTYADMNGTSTFISKGLDIAFTRGMVCVNSAANSGNDPWFYISAPADAINALAIGAVNAAGNYASFSSQGPSFDGRVKPDVVAQGQQSVLSSTSGNITTASGTSFSGPITAGMVACLWQALPSATNAEIMQLIKQSASIYNNPTNELGYGIPDFSLALNSGLLKVNTVDQQKFMMYPNPVVDSVSIAFPAGYEDATVYFYNSMGQLILSKELNAESKKVDLAGFSSGVYSYQITTKNGSQSGKISKR
ncbi:MAG: S8 family serine peptidase [Flavobacterium sp.]|nr:S8 family serine peptidase [Flavobacterium sp.]